jgi:hypothetical protein
MQGQYPRPRIGKSPPLLGLAAVTTARSEPISQRLAAIREQLKLLADYL